MKKLLFASFLFLGIQCSAQAQTFNEFWLGFQKNMGNKEVMLKQISFPYSYSCNYFTDDGEITKQQFSEAGPDIFMNGNAFIKNTFGNSTIQGISIRPYKYGYLNEYLKTQFLKKYANLENIYVISEKGNEDDAVGYKAYFKKINNTYLFIGFEGQEQGD